MKLSIFIYFFVLVAFSACKQETFRGSTGTKQPAVTAKPTLTPQPPHIIIPKVSNNPIPETPWEGPEPTPCPPGTITQAQMISSELISGSPQQYLEYILSVSECGGIQEVASNQILFDIQYTTSFSGAGSALNYRILTNHSNRSDRKEIATGKLKTVLGRDLFGKEEPNVSHFKTDKFSIVKSDTVQIIFEIDFSGATFQRRPYNPTDYAQTYLKFANAAVTPSGNATKVKITGQGELVP